MLCHGRKWRTMKLRNDTEGKLQTGENCVVLLNEKTYQDTLLLLIIKKGQTWLPCCGIQPIRTVLAELQGVSNKQLVLRTRRKWESSVFKMLLSFQVKCNLQQFLLNKSLESQNFTGHIHYILFFLWRSNMPPTGLSMWQVYLYERSNMPPTGISMWQVTCHRRDYPCDKYTCMIYMVCKFVLVMFTWL